MVEFLGHSIYHQTAAHVACFFASTIPRRHSQIQQIFPTEIAT